MNKLFIRIWLANWIVFVLMVFGFITIFEIYRDKIVEQTFERPHRSPQELKDSLMSAIGNGQTPIEWLLQISEEKPNVFLVDENGNDIAGRRVPRYLMHFGNRNIPPNRMSSPPRMDMTHPFEKRSFSPFEKVVVPGYAPLKLLIDWRSLEERVRFFSPIVMVFIACLASGVVAILLARYITLPIKQLYKASDRVATGDFQSNVSASVGGRKDEIAELARRFDLMAKNLDAAYCNQKNLLADVSHELRSPLTRMFLISDMLEKATGDPPNNLLKRLRKELIELENLIDEVMTLTRFESESKTLTLNKMDILPIIKSLVEDASFEADAVNKSVSFSCGYKYLVAKVEPTYFSRAVENIVRNAVRHTCDNGKVDVKIICGENELQITVLDYGLGVDESDLKKIFSPFYRSALARAKFKGAGIGLALAERIIKSHKGRIAAKNSLPYGLEVTISLPLT